MLFMIVRDFATRHASHVSARSRAGRMFPDGLKYIDSWVEPNFSRCFQLMDATTLRLLQQWILQWPRIGHDIEIVRWFPARKRAEIVAPLLDNLSDNS